MNSIEFQIVRIGEKTVQIQSKPQIRSNPNRNKLDRMNILDEFKCILVRMSSNLDDILDSDGISD